MDTVLIVDSDLDCQEQLQQGLSKLHHFKILSATDGEMAIDLLQKEKVSVLVTEMNIPKVDGLDLLSHVTTHYPNIPCIAMSSYGKPWFKKRKVQRENLYHIQKPFKIGVLMDAVMVALNIRDEGHASSGISVGGFLPMIEAENKTCRLEVAATGKGKGYLYFLDGVLFDANYQNLHGEKAVSEMCSWEGVTLKFSDLPSRRTIKRVQTPLMDIVGASWQKGEPENGDQLSLDLLDETLDLVNESSLKDKLAPRIEMFTEEIKAIQGSKGFAVIDHNDEIIFLCKVEESFNPKHLLSVYQQTGHAYGEAAQADNRANAVHGMIIQDSEEILIGMSRLNESTAATHILGSIAHDGDWHLMQKQLENLWTGD